MAKHYHVLAVDEDGTELINGICSGEIVHSGFGAGSPDYVVRSIELGDELGEDSVSIHVCSKRHGV